MALTHKATGNECHVRKVFVPNNPDTPPPPPPTQLATQLPMSGFGQELLAAAAADGGGSRCAFAAADRNLNDGDALPTQPSAASGLAEGLPEARCSVF